MAFLDPFAVDGATITGAQLRGVYYDSVKGRTGVLAPTALKFVPVAGSPGVGGFMPGAGAVAVQSRREAYRVDNPAMDGDALLDVPPAGSSGATRYVVIEVTDPQFHGQESAVTGRLVSSLAGLTRPHMVIARIRQAAGAGFDATTPVDDMRVIANPMTWPEESGDNLEGSAVHALTETGAGGQYWPATGVQEQHLEEVYVPEWATVAVIRAT